MPLTKMGKASKEQVLKDGYRQISSSILHLLTLRSILDIQVEIIKWAKEYTNLYLEQTSGWEHIFRSHHCNGT